MAKESPETRENLEASFPSLYHGMSDFLFFSDLKSVGIDAARNSYEEIYDDGKVKIEFCFLKEERFYKVLVRMYVDGEEIGNGSMNGDSIVLNASGLYLVCDEGGVVFKYYQGKLERFLDPKVEAELRKQLEDVNAGFVELAVSNHKLKYLRAGFRKRLRSILPAICLGLFIGTGVGLWMGKTTSAHIIERNCGVAGDPSYDAECVQKVLGNSSSDIVKDDDGN